MAQKTSLQARLIDQRVRALAIVYLTRRPDLIVKEETADYGIDLLVSLVQAGKPGLRQFGVELQGVWSKVTAAHANGVLRPSMQRLLRYSPFPFPVVLLLFTMENDQGWYTWAAEPVVSGQGFQLLHHGDASCRPLDEQAVDEIVANVDRWYDAFFASTTREVVSERK